MAWENMLRGLDCGPSVSYLTWYVKMLPYVVFESYIVNSVSFVRSIYCMYFKLRTVSLHFWVYCLRITEPFAVRLAHPPCFPRVSSFKMSSLLYPRVQWVAQLVDVEQNGRAGRRALRYPVNFVRFWGRTLLINYNSFCTANVLFISPCVAGIKRRRSRWVVIQVLSCRI